MNRYAFALLFLFLLIQCNNKTATRMNDKINVTENLIEEINKDTNTETLLKKYFLNYNAISKDSEIIKLYSEKLNNLKKSLEKASFEIIIYENGLERKLPLKEIISKNNNSKSIVNIWFEDLEKIYYVCFYQDSIYSIIPIFQGDKIIGWY